MRSTSPDLSPRISSLAVVAGLVVAACGTGSSTPDPDGGPIPGAGNSLVRTAIMDVDTGDTYTQSEISVSAYGEEIIRTKLQIVFAPDATVSDANGLLNDLDANITTSISGLEAVVVRIPDPGSLDALDAIVTGIESRPFVWFAARSILPATSELPDNIPPVHDPAVRIRHHLAIGAAGAWNARLAVRDFPRVIVVDFFGNGPPNDQLEYEYVGTAATDFNTGALDSHGYHVAGIIAGAFGGDESARGHVTGMMPEAIRLSVVDLTKADPLDTLNRLLLQLKAVEGETAIVNTSLGWKCRTDVTCIPLESVRSRSAWWIQSVRQLGLEDRFLHLTSAGNIMSDVPTANQARYNWQPCAASLMHDLVDRDGNVLAPLTNTLVIENVVAKPDFPYDGPRCMNKGSFRGGHLGGIGTNVWSFTNAGSASSNKTGTSMAAPQVAGLAAYMLSIRPELTPQDLAAILRQTAVPVPLLEAPDCSDWATPAPLIQAYAALLALDRPGQGPEGMPVRLAILDIDGSGYFTESDIEAFTTAFETAQVGVGFGRQDLNNDGRSGLGESRSFDLDIDGLHAARGVTADIMGQTHSFNESDISDIEILCYYAYSSLFTGTDAARDALLEPYQQLGQCGEPAEFTINASFPRVVEPGVPEPFVVTAVDAGGQPAEGLFVEIDVNGGTVSTGSGSTDGNGRFQTLATLASGGSSITVTATVRDTPAGEIIDVVSRTATASGAENVRLMRRWDGITETSLPHFRVAAQFSSTPQGGTQIFNEQDFDTPSSQEDFSDMSASLVATGSGSFQGTSATAKAQGTRTEAARIVDGNFAGVVLSMNFSVSTTMTNPPEDQLSVSQGSVDVRSCYDFEVEGEDLLYSIEFSGDVSVGMHVGVILRGLHGGELVDFRKTDTVYAQSYEGFLGAGADYTFCIYQVAVAIWNSWERNHKQSEQDGQFNVRFTLEPMPPP